MAEIADKAGASQAAQVSAEAQAATIQAIARMVANAHQLMKAQVEDLAPEEIVRNAKHPRVRIQVGRRVAFAGELDKSPDKVNLTPETSDRIRAAIESPESVTGLVRFEVDGDIAYQVQNGRVAKQALDITNLRQSLASTLPQTEIQSQELSSAAVSDAAIPVAIYQELVELRASVQRLEDRLDSVQSQLSSGQLVPISLAIQQQLDRLQLPDLGRFFQHTTETIQQVPTQLGVFFNSSHERMVESFSRQSMRLLDTADQLKSSAIASVREAGESAKAKAASVAIASLGRDAFSRAASKGVLQQSLAILQAEGMPRIQGGLLWVDPHYELQLDGNRLTLTDRIGDRGLLLEARGNRITRNHLQLGDLGRMGETGLRATQLLTAAQQLDRQPQLTRGR